MSKEKNKEYFPHDQDASEDPKMMMLVSQLGLEGYGIYWILIEYLRKQPGYIAPLMILDSLARRFGCSREKFEVVLTKYNDLFDTPLFVINPGTFYSPSLNDRMAKLDGKRQMMKMNALKRWEKGAIAMQMQCDGNAIAMQSRVEKSRVKKSKVENSRVEERKERFALAVKEFSSVYPESMLNAFVSYWTEKNKSGTKMKFEMQNTFEINLRLSTWARREKDFSSGKSEERPIFY